MVTRDGKHIIAFDVSCGMKFNLPNINPVHIMTRHRHFTSESEVVSGNLLSVLRDKPREETCKVFEVGLGSAQCFDPNLASSVDNAGNASYPYASTSARRSTVVPATRPWTHFFTKSVPAVASKGFKGLVGTLIVSRILKFTFCKSIKTWQGKQTSHSKQIPDISDYENFRIVKVKALVLLPGCPSEPLPYEAFCFHYSVWTCHSLGTLWHLVPLDVSMQCSSQTHSQLEMLTSPHAGSHLFTHGCQHGLTMGT